MTLITFIELCAVIASGTFGALLARRKGMDFVGVLTVALIAAFGGGTVRDLFLDRQPLFWIANDHYPLIVFAIALVVALTGGRWLLSGAFERFLHVPDALGLGLFSMVGVQYALDAQTSLFIASLLGVTTGICGGLIGDVVCNDVPSVFVTSPLYATCSFAGCWSYLGIIQFPDAEAFALGIGIAVTVVLRLVALRYNWRLPNPGASPEAER